MNWLIVTGLAPYDGRYELDINAQPLTTREWGWAKRYAGYLPITLDEDTFTDPEMIAVLALVALRRNGKIDTAEVPGLWERLQDAPFGSTIGLEPGAADEDEEDDAGPPPPRTGSSSSSNGEGSTTGSESSEPPPSPTGSPPWATSVSDPVTLGS